MKQIIFLYIIFTFLISKSQNPILTYWNTDNGTYSINKKNIIYLQYSNLFFLKEMNKNRIGTYLNTKHGSFIFDYEKWGSYKYNQNKSSVSFIKSFGKDLNIALGAQSFLISQIEYPPSFFRIKPNIGINFNINENNSLYTSLNGGSFFETTNFYPEVITVNWDYKISAMTSSLLTIKQSLKGREVSLGINLQPKQAWNIFIEASNSEIPIKMINQISQKAADVFISQEFHQKLGISNQIGVAFKW